MCVSSLAVWEKKEKMCHCQLPSLSNTAFFCVELSFIFFCGCVYYLHWKSVSTKLFTERKYCQNCAQLVANDLSLLINCMFVYSLLTLKWAKKYRMKTSQHSVKHALNTLIKTITVRYKKTLTKKAFKEEMCEWVNHE